MSAYAAPAATSRQSGCGPGAARLLSAHYRPVPVMMLGRLAVDHNHAVMEIGSGLLRDTIHRAGIADRRCARPDRPCGR